MIRATFGLWYLTVRIGNAWRRRGPRIARIAELLRRLAYAASEKIAMIAFSFLVSSQTV